MNVDVEHLREVVRQHKAALNVALALVEKRTDLTDTEAAQYVGCHMVLTDERPAAGGALRVCRECGTGLWDDGPGIWIDATDGDGCTPADGRTPGIGERFVHVPAPLDSPMPGATPTGLDPDHTHDGEAEGED